MDDVVISSKSLHEHLGQIFQKLEEYNLKVQLDKSEFLRKEVRFLGHVITPDGIKPNPSKIQAIQDAEKHYSTIKRELLAIVDCCKHFRPYIFGREFLIETDHKPLGWLFSLKDPNSRPTLWRRRLEEFQYKIQYKKGKENMVADALSRIEINIKERVSNYDDAALLSVLGNADLEDLTPHNCDQILAQSIDNPNEPDNNEEQGSSGATRHNSVENPIFTMPISEKPLNHLVNRVVLKLSDQHNVKFTRPFTKHHYLVNVRRGHEIENLTQSLRQIVDPENLYGIYFQDQELESTFIKICQLLFDKNVKFNKWNTFAKDVENPDEQSEIINNYHSQNHNGPMVTKKTIRPTPHRRLLV
ncbi:hypothetical protein Trydic_g771 [Trypoxylus dichotomus]